MIHKLARLVLWWHYFNPIVTAVPIAKAPIVSVNKQITFVIA